uniref:Uncharacterized protein n=1 Tax=viral metagenome TaxID=1070528 RepID=A0A6C0EQH6_9ZZZZ
MTLIEGLLISISVCLISFLLIYIQITAAIIIIKNLENKNKDLENIITEMRETNKELVNRNKIIKNIITEIIDTNKELKNTNAEMREINKKLENTNT